MKFKTSHLFIVSLVLHLAVVLVLGHYKAPRLWENGAIADHMLAGEGYTIGFSIPGEPTSWQAPFYPYFLAGMWSVVGKTWLSHLLVSILQCLLVASMVWPMSGLSRRWFPEIPPWIVQTIVVVAPLYLWYPSRIHQVAFILALQPWLLWGWLEFSQRRPLQAIGVGVLTGFAALIQPVLLGTYGIIGIVHLVKATLQSRWVNAAHLVLAGVAVLVVLTPWTIRNYRVNQKILLVKDSFGKEFWMGNNPHATGTGYTDGGVDEITNVYPPLCFKDRGRIPEVELMDAMTKEAFGWIRANPRDFIAITGKKILWFWTFAPRNLVKSTGDAEALVFRGFYMAYWLVLVALAIAGIVVYQPSKECLLIMTLFIVTYSLIYGLTHVGQARYRGEMEFVILPAAAAGLFFLYGKLTGNRKI